MHHGWLDEKSDENGIDGKHTVYIDIITFSYRHVRTSYLIPNSFFFSRLFSLYLHYYCIRWFYILSVCSENFFASSLSSSISKQM